MNKETERKYYHYLPLEVYPEYHREIHQIDVAAALLCCGIELKSTLMGSSGEPSFIFAFDYDYAWHDAKETPEKIIEQYIAGKLKVNAKSFFRHLKTLRERFAIWV